MTILFWYPYTQMCLLFKYRRSKRLNKFNKTFYLWFYILNPKVIFPFKDELDLLLSLHLNEKLLVIIENIIDMTLRLFCMIHFLRNKINNDIKKHKFAPTTVLLNAFLYFQESISTDGRGKTRTRPKDGKNGEWNGTSEY